jgi:hypothetical protein
LSAIIALLMVEGVARWWYGIGLLEVRNYASIRIYPDTRENVQVAYEPARAETTSPTTIKRGAITYHPAVGWVQTESGYYEPTEGWRLLPTGDLQGLGLYYAKPPLSGVNAPVLAVGDSFTIGPGYDSAVAWPRQLADMIRSPVINAGVGGYGVDQMYLYLKVLLERVTPSLVLFAFIPDDLRRAELSTFHSAPKPYFDVENDSLVLRNVPVPRYEPTAKHIGAFRKVAGYSYAVHRIALGLGYAKEWMVEHGELREVHKRGREVGCLIMSELRRIQDDRKVPVVVMALHSPDDLDGSVYPESFRKQQKTVACAAAEGLAVIDTLPLYKAMLAGPGASRQQILSTYWLYPRDPHPSPTGYRYIAELALPYVTKTLETERAKIPISGAPLRRSVVP